VVHRPFDDGGGHVVVAEYGSPAGELEVGGDDEASLIEYSLLRGPCVVRVSTRA
jgi:hypothetical protein